MEKQLKANLEGREWPRDLDGDETFKLTDHSNDDKEWEKIVERAVNAQLNLRKVLSTITDEQLDQDLLEEKLLDIMLHDAYHTGQIVQLRKMQGSWPSIR